MEGTDLIPHPAPLHDRRFKTEQLPRTLSGISCSVRTWTQIFPIEELKATNVWHLLRPLRAKRRARPGRRAPWMGGLAHLSPPDPPAKRTVPRCEGDRLSQRTSPDRASTGSNHTVTLPGKGIAISL